MDRPVGPILTGLSVLLLVSASCRPSTATTTPRQATTLRIGFGLSQEQRADVGMRRTARNIALEALIGIQRNGRPIPRLAESWSVSEDGLKLLLHLPKGLKFHNGTPADAAAIQGILQAKAPAALGPIFQDVAEIRAVSDRDVEIRLRRRSPFVLERLDDDIPIADPKAALAGTGPFYISSERGDIQMHANADYHGGRPIVDNITFKPYPSLRAAWADLLRGQVDVLYDVGPDALESLESSTQVRIFPFQRAQVYVVLFNFRRPFFRDPNFRRKLNDAIDRTALVADALGGHAIPAAAAISPRHWAYSADLPQFQYSPRVRDGGSPKQLTCLFMDPSIERLALLTQRQLQSIDVDLQLKLVTPSEALGRLEAGDFDAVLGDFGLGPNLARSYEFWHSTGPYNFGRYNNGAVDAALDSIRHAADDEEYRKGVAAFDRAIVDDPPGIFLASGERARAVSSRFDVPADPDAAIFRTLHLWRPVGDQLVRVNP